MAPGAKEKESKMAMTQEEAYVHVELKSLPSYSGLASQVQAVVRSSTWMEVYGYEWLGFCLSLACLPLGLHLLSRHLVLAQVLGLVLLGFYHNTISSRYGHLSAHDAMSTSKGLNKFLSKFCLEFVGSFSSWCAYDSHVRIHHPHMNIIALGDSSTWRVPSLGCYTYMFVAPLMVPLVTPFVALQQLLEFRQWRQLAGFLVVMPAGLAVHLYLLTRVCGFSLLGSIICLYAYRAVLSIPYIHVNIFQHIGLPMYDQKDRPVRIYQMSTGSLNLGRNWILDLGFGHTLIDCHVEHHLFPKLGDNMCYKIKPIVTKYLKENGLPYNEDSYWSRLKIFIKDYDKLMVKAPPITHFVGIQ